MGLQTVEHNLATVQNVITSKRIYVKMLFLYLILGLKGRRTVKLGMIEGSRRGLQRIRWLSCITDTMDMSLSKLWEMLKDRED